MSVCCLVTLMLVNALTVHLTDTKRKMVKY